MMSFLITAAAAIFVLGSLIFVHELGHFMAAKRCGVAVLKFSIGFGPTLFRFRKKETDYQLCLVPLGGYVRMVGDEPDPVPGEQAEIPDEQLSPEARAAIADKSRWFLEKSLPARAFIVAAGPLMNFIFAFFLVVVSSFFYGELKVDESARIGAVMTGSPAEVAGIKADDRVQSINGKPVSNWLGLSELIHNSGGEILKLNVLRENQPLKFSVKAEQKQISGGADKKALYLIGIQPFSERIPVSFVRSLEIGGKWTAHATIQTYAGIWGLLRGTVSPKELAGPIGIIQAAGQQAKRGFEYLLSLTAILSISLAVLNLLPIPVLDGGHLGFFLIEGLFGPVSVRKREVAQHVGLLLLLSLMIFAVYNDLSRKPLAETPDVSWKQQDPAKH